MDKTDCKKPVKPYSKPTLTIYGKVQELTKAVGTMGQIDGGLVLERTMTAV
jgi:hypothetical protein